MLIFLGGAGLTVLVTATTVIFYKNIGEKKETKGAVLVVGKNFINGALVLLVGFVITSLSFSTVFNMAMMVAFSFLLIIFFLSSNETYQLQKEDYFKELKRKEVVFLLLFYGLYIFHAGGDSVSIPAIWKLNLGFSSAQIGVLMGIPNMTIGVIGAVALGWYAKGKVALSKTLVFFGCLSSGVGHLLLAYAVNFDQAMLGRLVHITGDTIMGLFLTVELAFLFSKKSIGGNFGLANLVIALISTASVIVAGIVGNYFPHQYFLYGSALLSVIGAFWSLGWKVQFSREKS
jgi:hypothetical protein